MTVAADYPFLNLMWTMLLFFGWILFIWLLITVYMDLFRRKDIGGLGKTGWVLFTIFLPLIGTFVYLIAEGRAMQDRTREQMVESQRQMDAYVRSVASTSGGAADEIAHAKSLLDSGAITQEEFQALKAKALGTSATAASDGRPAGSSSVGAGR